MNQQTVTINTKKMLLSGSRRVYKTEGFVSATKKIVAIDVFVSRVAESLFYADINVSGGQCMTVETDDRQFTLFFTHSDDSRLRRGDVVFYKYLSATPHEGGRDRRLSDYLVAHSEITLTVRTTDDVADCDDLAKIYLVSGSASGVNFPLLSQTQRKIVETENANVLVQGVAGSGKTNVCVEKIVYCACRNYRGKVLYTTFSRGLLAETQTRVSLFLKNIQEFISAYESGAVVFLDENHRRAVENKLGLPFDTDDDARMVESLRRIEEYLQKNVDYLLISDIYEQFFANKPIVGEWEFLNDYLPNCRLSGALEKIKNVAPEIIYKEIYGMIYGKYEPDAPAPILSREAYIQARQDSFTRAECDVIYTVATDYAAYLEKTGRTDNNLMSRQLLGQMSKPLYSVGIIDEVQDFTQVNLCLIKSLCRKLFCVGDALQMINPAYFGFGYLKRLMYGDVTGVSQLTNNYRSTQTIERIAEQLGQLNVQRFGTHSFVLHGESVPSSVNSAAVFVNEKNFVPKLVNKRLENITVVVASQRKKEELRKVLPKTEILTVSESKGLERNTVVLVDVLSDNADKWNYLQNMSLNRKTADENSVFRYYFNLFYVGVSRAKQYLFVVEHDYPQLFEQLFDSCFERQNGASALATLLDVAGKLELDDEELVDRIQKFCQLEQYENARFAADRMSTDQLRQQQLVHIGVHENFLRFGKLRDAGVEYWKNGMDFEAREMFTRSGDTALFPLMDACKSGSGTLDVDIVKFLPLVLDNDTAKNLILETLNNDYRNMADTQKQINAALKRRKQ